MATELSQKQIQQLFDKQDFNTITAEIDDMAHHDLVSHKINALLELDQLDAAMALINRRLNQRADDKVWQAYNHYLKSQIHGAEAEEANVFTVSGYISDAIDSLEQAQKLQPNNLEINQSLIGLLNGLPGLFGGDAEQGLVLAKRLEVQYPLEAGVMMIESLAILEQKNKAEQKINTLFELFPNNHTVALQASRYYEQIDNLKDNQIFLKLAVDWPMPKGDDLIASAYLLKYAFAQNSIELNADLEKALISIKAFQSAPFDVRYSYRHWPKLYEAQIRLLKGNKVAAVALAKQISQISRDDRLVKKAKNIINKGKI